MILSGIIIFVFGKHFFSLESTFSLWIALFFLWKALFFESTFYFLFMAFCLDFIDFIYRILIKKNPVSFKVRISNSLLFKKKSRFQNLLFLIKNLEISLFSLPKFIIFIFKTHFIFKIHVVSIKNFKIILDTYFPTKNADDMHLL